MVNTLLRYKIFIVLAIFNVLLLAFQPDTGWRALLIETNIIMEMAFILPPIFILLGLIDIWMKKETVINILGKESGYQGMAISFLLGSAAAGPLYAAFPVACIMLKKGAKLSNVIVFLGAWSNTKIPMLLFEITSMGWDFMLIRLIVNVFGVVLTAIIIEKLISISAKKSLYYNAKKLE